MTCNECQLQIFDENELDQEAVSHLAACDECRELDSEVRLNANALAAMREDVMPVRVQKQPRRWPWVLAAAAAALIALSLSYSRKPEAVPVQMAVLHPPTAAPVLPRIPQPKPHPIRHAVRPAKPVEADEPLTIKLLTDDPDVVIYWLIEPKGEQGI